MRLFLAARMTATAQRSIPENAGRHLAIEHFQEKRAAIFRPECVWKQEDRAFPGFAKSGNALGRWRQSTTRGEADCRPDIFQPESAQLGGVPAWDELRSACAFWGNDGSHSPKTLQ